MRREGGRVTGRDEGGEGSGGQERDERRRGIRVGKDGGWVRRGEEEEADKSGGKTQSKPKKDKDVRRWQRRQE